MKPVFRFYVTEDDFPTYDLMNKRITINQFKFISSSRLSRWTK